MSGRNRRVLVPEAKAAMDRFKQEIANSMNIDLKEGYNGDIFARDAGRIGGQMVKRMISYAEQNLKQDSTRKNNASRRKVGWTLKKGEEIMTTSNSGEAKQKLSKFKNEVASSMNINLQQGYNGDITARDAGRIGGQMVKRMIEYAEQHMNGQN